MNAKVKKQTFSTAYSPSKKCQISFVDEDGNQQSSLVEQHHKDLCDVYNILSRYDKTGIITHVNNAKAMYGDFTEINEYREALNLVQNAQSSFDEMPSNIRERFRNNPGLFMEFITNPANLEEAVELGLAERRPQLHEKTGTTKGTGVKNDTSDSTSTTKTEKED